MKEKSIEDVSEEMVDIKELNNMPKEKRIIERLTRDKNLLELKLKCTQQEMDKMKIRFSELEYKEKIIEKVEKYLKERISKIKEKYPNEKNCINELEKVSDLIQRAFKFRNVEEEGSSEYE